MSEDLALLAAVVVAKQASRSLSLYVCRRRRGVEKGKSEVRQIFFQLKCGKNRSHMRKQHIAMVM